MREVNSGDARNLWLRSKRDGRRDRAGEERDRVFFGELSKPTGTNYSVKAPIEEGGKTEHFWLTEVSFQNNEFKGTIGNEPGIVGNVKMGQSWTIKKTAISDWMFMRDGKIYGNYTMRPLLRTLPAEEAEKYRSMHADP